MFGQSCLARYDIPYFCSSRVIRFGARLVVSFWISVRVQKIIRAAIKRQAERAKIGGRRPPATALEMADCRALDAGLTRQIGLREKAHLANASEALPETRDTFFTCDRFWRSELHLSKTYSKKPKTSIFSLAILFEASKVRVNPVPFANFTMK